MSVFHTCERCSGSGHDKGGEPIIKFEHYTDKEGKPRKRHVTVKQGSGCYKCLGLGVVEEAGHA